MTNGQRRVANTVGLGAAGLAGGLLMVYDPVARGLLGQDFNILGGAWLGVAFAAFFWLTGRESSISRALTLAAISAVAFFVALSTAALVQSTTIEGNGREPQNPLAFVAGGIVGGLIVSFATFVLYAEDRRRISWRIAACTVGGGLAGLLAVTIGSDIDGPQSSGTFPPILMVWQPAFGLVVGLLWPVTDSASSGDPASSS